MSFFLSSISSDALSLFLAEIESDYALTETAITASLALG
jgi:hypothetical protein